MLYTIIDDSFPYASVFTVNSLKEFGKLLSNIEDEREKIVGGVMSMGVIGS